MISIVTVVMNRKEHLLRSVLALSRLQFHQEHIVIDYGSTPSVPRDELPNDSRIKLIRCENPDKTWWLTHSYNLGFSLATQPYILKVDADIILKEEFFVELQGSIESDCPDLMCSRLTLQDWALNSSMFPTNGLFLAKTSTLKSLGGFNPYLKGWGWDEIDLYSRFFLCAGLVKRLPQHGISEIQHSDDLRESSNVGVIQSKTILHSIHNFLFPRVTAAGKMRCNNTKNKIISSRFIEDGFYRSVSFESYISAWRLNSILPLLPIKKVSLNYQINFFVLLARHLLNLSKAQTVFFLVLAFFSIGPIYYKNSKKILRRNGIDISLFH